MHHITAAPPPLFQKHSCLSKAMPYIHTTQSICWHQVIYNVYLWNSQGMLNGFSSVIVFVSAVKMVK